jgi:hypothetical protein
MSRPAHASLGSARVARAGDCVLAVADFYWNFAARKRATSRESLFRRDAETSTRDTCAPQT